MSTTRVDVKPLISRAESPKRGVNKVEHRKATAT